MHVEEHLTQSKRDQGLRTFLKGINPRVNVKAQLGFRLPFFEATVQHFSHFGPGTYLSSFSLSFNEVH